MGNKKHKRNSKNNRYYKEKSKPASATLENDVPMWYEEVTSEKDFKAAHIQEIYNINGKVCASSTVLQHNCSHTSKEKGHKQVNCYDNPNCLLRLEVTEKADPIESLLGPPPANEEKQLSMVGLLNLGATCYANVLIQVLI